MAKTRTFQVFGSRIRYVCLNCGAKRSLPVPSYGRTRNVRCHKCGEKERCNLNRRQEKREQQSGQVTMTLANGKEVPVDLCDISLGGVGLVVTPGSIRSLRLNDEVRFRCSWNPRLFIKGRYIVTSVSGDKVGIKNIALRNI